MARFRSSSRDELMISNNELNGSMRSALFWSRRGDVACYSHAPDSHSERWQTEGWCSIPEAENRRHGLAYQCPRCAPDGRVHRHMHAAEREANGIARPA
jgi:hypothetical protein